MKARSSIRPTHPRKVKNLQPNEKKPEEKKTTNNNSSVPKVVKSHTKRPDIFEMQKPFVTSFSCISDVIKAFSNGTDELRNLLNFECELIYECKVCRGLFRSLANFLQHKRSHCLESSRDLKRHLLNGEVTDNVIHVNGTNPKGQLLTTRKTMRKDVYDILRKVGNMTEEPLPERFFTRDIGETDAALLNFFQQEGKAATEERGATVGSDGFVIGARPHATATDKSAKEIPLSGATSYMSNKQSDVSSRPSDLENCGKSPLQCSNCDEPFSSVSELTAHVNLQSCERMRRCYVCPICKKVVATPWSVYRHLRRVHYKTSEQVRKLRKNIEKKMVKAEELKLRNPPSPVRKAILSEKTREVMRPLGNTNRVSVGVNSETSQLTTAPVLFKRARSPDVNETDTLGTLEDSPTSAEPPPNPPKKIKIEKDLSWLKRGPSVPIIGGPLTRTARALYGSPRKINPTETDLTDWNKTPNEISGEGSDVRKEETQSLEAGPCRSTQDDSSENEVENPSGPEDASPSDVGDNDSEDPSEAEDKKPKDEPSSISNRLSSSQENVRSLTSSVDSFDSTPSKERKATQDLNDQTSTSGVETEVDRPTTTTSSAGPSDDDCGDGDNLGDSNDLPPPLIGCDAIQMDQSPSVYSEDGHLDSPEETSLDNHPPQITGDKVSRSDTIPVGDTRSVDDKMPPSANEIKPAPSPSFKKSQLPHRSSSRETDEDEHSCSDLATSITTPKDVTLLLDSDDSNSADEEKNDDQLRLSMMEVIFGDLSPASFNVSRVRDSS